MQKIIVDGYNVIHADPRLKQMASAGMQSARDELLARLEAYLSHKRLQVTVVFDGAGGMLDAESPVPGRLQVLYSAAGQSADEVIVATLQSHANARQFIVVTSDMADIGRAARALGATVMPSAEFVARMETCPAPGESPSTQRRREKPEPSDDDVDYWLRKFSGSGDDGDGGKSGPSG